MAVRKNLLFHLSPRGLLRMFSDGRSAGLFIMAVSLAALGGALISEYVFGLRPCVLCIYQRWPHAFVIAAGLLAALAAHRKRQKLASFLIFICAPVYLAGACIAFYHVGVEQAWWEGTKGCSFPAVPQGDFEAFKQALLNAPLVSCKDVPFVFLGLSMAGWNALLSLGMTAVSAVSAILVIRRANGFL